MTNHEIDRLLRRTAAGDKAAIAELYEAFRMPVYYYALQLLGNKELAEDVMQETFVSILRSSGTYRQAGKASAWIFTITKNKAIDWKRKECPSVSFSDAENLLEPVADLAETVDDTELAMLSCLNEKERDIVILRVLCGFTLTEIAQERNLPKGSVFWTYNNALKKIQKHLKEGGGTDVS